MYLTDYQWADVSVQYFEVGKEAILFFQYVFYHFTTQLFCHLKFWKAFTNKANKKGWEFVNSDG